MTRFLRCADLAFVTFWGLVFLAASESFAIAPRFVTDEELAAYPLIVVAQWDKAPATSHNKYMEDEELGQVAVKWELYTRLNVLSVVKGAIEPGKHDLLVNMGITWREDGTYVNSGTSTELLGDVKDVTAPCLWFLKRSRSWDETRKDSYLTVGHYREVQPLELKDFYNSLGKREARVDVPQLLVAERPQVSRRVLRYLCGGEWPWPYDDGTIYSKPQQRGAVLRDEANRVWDYLQTAAKAQRPLAASVYAELAGKDGISRIRTLVDDSDPEVRGIAVGVLSRHRDVAALDRFGTATRGPVHGMIACQVIKELAEWKDERTVPALIGYLQNDKFAFQIGDDIGIPALKAHQALAAITGHAFPFDVETSQRAWEEALRLGDPAARIAFLAKAAPGGKTPLVATAVGLPSKEPNDSLKRQYERLREDEFAVTIRLRNLSSGPVTVLSAPSVVEMRWPGGVSSRGAAPAAEEEKLEFTTIQPAEGIAIQAILTQGFLIADPAERELKLSFLANGNRVGKKAWIGTINVEFGVDWKYERRVKYVEETWANGNLKAAGATVNGVKLGEWNYFNEEGDRIRIAYPGTGRGTAICNPEHEKNKGAGKRSVN